MDSYEAPMPDIILAGDFNFLKASWNAGMGTPNPDNKCNNTSLQQLLSVASDLNLLQKVSEGTRVTRSGSQNILELIFTNNHNLYIYIYSPPRSQAINILDAKPPTHFLQMRSKYLTMK